MEKQPVPASEIVEKITQGLSSSDDTPLEGEAAAPFDVLETMKRAGFPDKFRRTDWTTPDFVGQYTPPDARAAFRDFRGLFLTGKTGRKKTSSLCLMARDWLTRVGRKGAKAWGFVSFPDLCTQLQAAWDEGAAAPRRIITTLTEIPLLIVDDVGAEKTSEFVLQSAYLLFNKREFAELPTYGTSNLTMEQLAEKLDDRIASRIKGMCNVVAVGGEDQRGRR